MNILFITQVDLAKVVGTVSKLLSSIFNKLVTIDTLQVVKLVEAMNVVLVVELKKILLRYYTNFFTTPNCTQNTS